MNIFRAANSPNFSYKSHKLWKRKNFKQQLLQRKCGPNLSLTRWHGHFRQVEYIVRHIEVLNETLEKPGNLVNLSALDSIVVQHVYKNLKHLLLLRDFLEIESPQAD